MKVAILGAPQTGKTQLRLALSEALLAQNLWLDVTDTAPVEELKPQDMVLLCGLDLGPVSEIQSQMDQTLRASLSQTGFSFQVVYGSGPQRLENALFCIGRHASHSAKQMTRPEPPVRWSGPCETCGDGDCEHRLFTQLIKP